MDPSAIRNDSSDLAKSAYRALEDFFVYIVELKLKGNAEGRRLLSNLHELNETRLGMSSHSPQGRSIGDGYAEMLWDALDDDLLKFGIIQYLEDVPLFIDGIADDRISDIVAKIILPQLIEFTNEVFSDVGSGLYRLEKRAYPTFSEGDWTDTKFEVVVSNEGGFDALPIVLVPTQWVSKKLLMRPRQFYNRFATDYIQLRNTTYGLDGKEQKPPKGDIYEDNPEIKLTNRLESKRAWVDSDETRNLVAEYRSLVDSRFEPLTFEEMMEFLYGPELG